MSSAIRARGLASSVGGASCSAGACRFDRARRREPDIISIDADEDIDGVMLS